MRTFRILECKGHRKAETGFFKMIFPVRTKWTNVKAKDETDALNKLNPCCRFQVDELIKGKWVKRGN
jgi:hypothetical protein